MDTRENIVWCNNKNYTKTELMASIDEGAQEALSDEEEGKGTAIQIISQIFKNLISLCLYGVWFKMPNIYVQSYPT